MRSISNSRSRRSCTISMCRRPRKPQRKPKPRACETSGSNCSAASFSCSFSSESRSCSYSFGSTGYKPANTWGLISLKPSRASVAGRSASVMVSPTRAAFSSLMLEMMKPTSPADSCGCCFDRSEEHTSELQSHHDLVCRLLLEKKKKEKKNKKKKKKKEKKKKKNKKPQKK